MVNVVVFVECWYLVWWVGLPSISSSIMECGLVVSKSFSRSRPRSDPRRSRLDSPPLNKIMTSVCMVIGVCACVSSTYVVRLCVGNDAIYLDVCSGLHDLRFSQGF